MQGEEPAWDSGFVDRIVAAMFRRSRKFKFTREQIEEAFQEAIADVLKKAGKPRSPGQENLSCSPPSYGVVFHKCVDIFRREMRHKKAIIRIANDVRPLLWRSANMALPEDQIEILSEINQAFEAARKCLKKTRDLAVFDRLRVDPSIGAKELGLALGISEDAARQARHRLIVALQKLPCIQNLISQPEED